MVVLILASHAEGACACAEVPSGRAGYTGMIDRVKPPIPDAVGLPDERVMRAWIEEAQRRRQQVFDGTVKPVPGDRVLANLHARLKQLP